MLRLKACSTMPGTCAILLMTLLWWWNCSSMHEITGVQSTVGMSCLEDSVSQHLPPLNFRLFPFSIMKYSLRGWYRGLTYGWISITHLYLVLWSLVSLQSPLVIAKEKKKLLWSTLITTLSMGNKHNYLDWNLSGVSCSLSKKSYSFHARVYELPAMGSSQVSNTRCKFSPGDRPAN